MSNPEPAQVRSIETAIRILETIESLDGAGITEVANELGVAKSTVHNHVKTLESNGYVVQNGDSYHIGLRFLEHGGLARHRKQLYRIGKPEVESLAEKTGEFANLVIEENGLGVYLAIEQGETAVNVSTYIGKRELLHSTAVGKAILAYLPEHRIDEIIELHGLPQLTDRTVSTRTELETELENVREHGYAVDWEENLDGLRCVGAPIKSEDGTAVGAISISGPTSRMNEETLRHDLAEEVQRSANIIEVNMMYEY